MSSSNTLDRTWHVFELRLGAIHLREFAVLVQVEQSSWSVVWWMWARETNLQEEWFIPGKLVEPSNHERAYERVRVEVFG